jgi:uncharacterized membrane protein YccC
MAKLSAHTRMAAQMFVALALAFAIGMPLFHEHWSWVVLTAFIVCSGAVGHGEATRKGLLRVGGAIGGTLVAALVSRIPLTGVENAAVIFVVLFFGIWLREKNYAYWAACATLLFALLQGSAGVDPLPLFAVRVLAIIVGALCGIAAVAFVLPFSAEQLARRRARAAKR